MGKATGFLEFSRTNPGYQPVEERTKHFKEFTAMLPEDEMKKQGGRCMDCGIPYCHSMGCPVYNLIPEWNDLVFEGQWEEAWKRLELTNTLPEVTGRICPAPCEPSCTLSINDPPVSIRHIELQIVEKAFANGWVKPFPPKFETGKKVAVVGSGPSGLAAAQQLRRMGHAVTLFEKDETIGGILRLGIPDFKLEKHILDRRIDQMKAEGIVFKTGVNVGTDITAAQMKKDFDGIILTMGAGEPRDLKVEGRELNGAHFAMEFLIDQNRTISGAKKIEETISANGKNVLVIGGGDTGADCVGTAIRQGAKKVWQFEIMPKPFEWENSWNPSWPEWPRYLRTGSSHDEGCERDWNINTRKIHGTNGKVTKVDFVRVEWKDGKPVEIAGSEFSLDAELVLLAMGFVHVVHPGIVNDLGCALDERGNIKTTNYATSVDGVFAAGDAMVGASLIVRAIWHGREAAQQCDAYLMKK